VGKFLSPDGRGIMYPLVLGKGQKNYLYNIDTISLNLRMSPKIIDI